MPPVTDYPGGSPKLANNCLGEYGEILNATRAVNGSTESQKTANTQASISSQRFSMMNLDRSPCKGRILYYEGH